MPPRFAHPLLAASVAPRGWGRFYEQVFRNESHSHCLNRLLLLGVFVMRRSTWTPSIVPRGDDQNVYIVLDDFGRSGHAYRETDVETADLETTITDMLDGQYKNPVRVVAFNTSEQWSQDVSEDVAQEIRRRCDLQLCDVPSGLQDFVERHEGRDRRQLTLRLV
jgi:hypothetical protein